MGLKTAIIIAIATILSVGVVAAQSITTTGTWSPHVGAADLVGGELPSTLQSAANQTLASVSSNGAWRVDVSKTDVNWPSALHLFIQRTGVGSGRKKEEPTGGFPYGDEITGSPREFFSGPKNRNSIPLQWQMTGMSLAVPAGTYSTNVTFTITAQ